jgi:mono/diheme cytochrome c family protein
MRLALLLSILAPGLLALLALVAVAEGDRKPDPERGLRHLLDKAYLPFAFDQALFDQIWRSWPEPLRSEAEPATPEARREMAWRRYGLTARPDAGDPRPLQYVVDERGRWAMSCLACHGGQVGGRSIPGLPNSTLALQTFAEDVVETKRLLGIPLMPEERMLGFFPLGHTNGTTNAVMFSVSLLTFRNEHLDLVVPKRRWPFVHHDLDAPPWWHFKKRTRLYIDGFAPKGVRPLLQFTLTPKNKGETVRGWEEDFEDIYAYLESIEAPASPLEVDAALVEKGEAVFLRSCAVCHGTYGDTESYPNRIVPIDVVKTDGVRLTAISKEQRTRYAHSWLTHYDPKQVIVDPGGYVAPPLDGIWASAPYLHNGSVPTLWHVLHPDQRPAVWKRSVDGYDEARVGLAVEIRDELPEAARNDRQVRRTWFDTRARGKSAAGHDFPAALSLEARRALLEYLKTL